MDLHLIVYGIWVASEILLSLRFRSVNATRMAAGRHILRNLWLYILAAIALALAAHYLLPVPIEGEGTMQAAGTALTILGMIIRSIAVITLGQMFTVDLAIKRGHRLKTDGIYTYLRHPSYLGLLLCFYGLGLSLNNWISLACITVPITLLFLVRIRREEELLISEFGDAYRYYSRRTYRLLPFVY